MLKRMRLKRPPLVLFVALLVVAVLMMVSLPGAIENAYSSVTLTWTPPTTNTDGTELTDLAGYLVYYGTSSGSYGSPIDVGNVNTYAITNLAAGSYYFAVKAYDTAGINSDFSNEVLKVEQGTPVTTTPPPATTTPPPATTTPPPVTTTPLPDTTTPTVNTFTVPATAKSLTVSITSFTATDNVGVTGYIITESATSPSATASSWSKTAPTSYTAAAAGTHTLYAYAKDAAGNVSAAKSASVNITVTGSTTADTTRPTVNAFTIPVTATSLTFSITSITATDSVGVTGYIITESATRPSATASGWSKTAPTSYTAAAAGKHTLYAYAKDAAGNVSAAKNASITITGAAGAAGALSDEIAIFFNGAWYIDTNGNGMWDGTTADTLYPNFGNGLYGAVPVTGDWDGSGVVRIGVFSNGTWYLDMNGNGVWDGPSVDKVISNFGQGLPNVIPVTGDWNGTGITKIGVFSNGTWYLDMNGNGVWDGPSVDKVVSNFGQGLPNVIPVTGDWNGTGTTKIGVFSNGTWYLDMNGNGVWDGPSVDKVVSNFGQGLPNAIPVTGDWNGTGTTKIGVFSNGTWYLDMNGNGIWEGASIDNEIPDFGKGMNGSIPVILKKK